MGTTRNRETDEKSDRSDTSVMFVFGTLGDTTWRIFVPTIGGTLLGAWADTVFSTKPWLMIAGIVVGVTLAALLVRAQIKNK